MAIYKLKEDRIADLIETSFEAESILERRDLQRSLREKIAIISPDTLVISEEFGEWEGSKRRIDLLGVDKEARLVVIELKRNETGAHMELQAIRSAAMLSTATFDRIVEIYARFLSANGQSEKDAQTKLLTFLGWDEPQEDLFASDVRIVLASAEFSKELTTSVIWLNERELDIRCVRLKLYKSPDDNQLFIDVQQVIPIPEAADYQINVREKAERSKDAKLAAVSNRDLTKYRFQGQTYGKGRLVLAVVSFFVEQNPDLTLDELRSKFPNRLQGNRVIEDLAVLSDPAKRNRRYFAKPDEVIHLANEGRSVVVCSQWGLNTRDFINYVVTSFGYEIHEA
jgi:hypothetical protein